MSMIDAIDAAIDRLLAKDPTKVEFHRAELAVELGWSLSDVSQALQEHRRAQGRHATQHILVARQNGPGAGWYLQSAASVGESLTVGHITHIITDAARRMGSDFEHELQPLRGSFPQVSTLIDLTMQQVSASLDSMNTMIQWVVTSNGVPADTRGVAAWPALVTPVTVSP